MSNQNSVPRSTQILAGPLTGTTIKIDPQFFKSYPSELQWNAWPNDGRGYHNLSIIECLTDRAQITEDTLWHVRCHCRKQEGTITTTRLRELMLRECYDPDDYYVCSCGRQLRERPKPLEEFKFGIFAGFKSEDEEALSYEKVPIPPDLRWAVWERDNFTCMRCGIRRNLSIDHIIAESKGGLTVLENLQTMCFPCNRKKGAR